MSRTYLTKLFLAVVVCSLVVVAGCRIGLGGWAKVSYERIEQLSAPLKRGSVLAVGTHNGSITISGARVSKCKIRATITAQAGTDEDARKLAEKTKIVLDRWGNKLTIKIKKPAILTNKSVKVDFNITVPREAGLDFSTHNGIVEVYAVTGRVKGSTHNGSITCRQLGSDAVLETHNGPIDVDSVSGSVNLRTHNGTITGRHIQGNVRVKTHNGPATFREIPGDFNANLHNADVSVDYAEAAGSAPNISIVTHNGDVDLVTPPGFSASVRISTHNGSIKTDLPITVLGKISRGKIGGTIGAGAGELNLETYNGSIRIK